MTVALTLGVLIVLAAGTMLLMVRLRAPRLPAAGWQAEAGAAFVQDEPRRRLAYAQAREDSEALGRVLARDAALLDRDWVEPAASLAKAASRRREEVRVQLAEHLDARDRAIGELTVVLYGRSKAGKSCLFSAFTGEGFDGIGDGRRNFTRERREHLMKHTRVVDSPGINAVGSKELEIQTRQAVLEADLLVVQLTDDAVFQEDFERLEELGESSRPVVVGVNVKSGNVERLLVSPEKVFRPRRLDPHIARIRSALPERVRAGSPVLPHHALAAARGRQASRGRRALALWEGSRVAALIAAVLHEVPAAVRFARRSADEAVQTACGRLLDADAEDAAEAAARQVGLTRSVDEIERILGEVERARSACHETVEAHFADSEALLLEALAIQSPQQFKAKAREALALKRLATRLDELLEHSAAQLQEKYGEFQADVRLAGRLAMREGGLKSLHEETQETLRLISEARSKAKRRKWHRIGAKAAGGIAVALAAETLVAVVAVPAVTKGIDRLLPDIEVPTENAGRRAERIRKVIDANAERATDVFMTSLEQQILTPARQQLIEPLKRQSDALDEVLRVLEASAGQVEQVRLRALEHANALREDAHE